ncbi:MAG: ABC transporter permease [Myxococcota bacterium]
MEENSPPDRLISPRIDAPLARLGETGKFVGRFFLEVVRPPYHISEVIRLCVELGVKTLPLVTLTGAITGLVFTQQSRPSLATFGAESWLPSLVTTSLVRSLAPLITALLCAGKVGSSIGAELSSMKVTEQIEALEVSAVDPYNYLVVPRTLATTLMIPVLTAYFAIVGYLGSWVNVRVVDGMSLIAFNQAAFSVTDMVDVGGALFRALTYGFTIGIIASMAGFYAGQGTRGVGRAANAAVVQAMVTIFIEEMMIVQLLNAIRGDAGV